MEAGGSVTAKLCAFARAYHSESSSQKIVDDYLAHDLMGQDEYQAMEQLLSCPSTAKCLASSGPSGIDEGMCPLLHRYISPIPLSRLAFTEEVLDRFAKDNGTVQYVICGAGLDTFAFRNANRKVRVFEVDHPSTQAYKMQKVRDLGWSLSGHARFVPVDFVGGDLAGALAEHGFSRELPSFFAVPGVSYYLPHDAFAKLVGTIAGLLGDKGMLMFDVPDDTSQTNLETKRIFDLARLTADLGEPMSGGYGEREVATMLDKSGLCVKAHLGPRDIQTMYFEGRDDGQVAYENVHFVLAQRKPSRVDGSSDGGARCPASRELALQASQTR